MTDVYTVMLLHPNGNRFLMEGVLAEIENKHDMLTFDTDMGYSQKFPKASWLEIKLTFQTPQDHSQVDELRNMIESELMFLYFKDVHPNLIKGIVTDVYLSSGYETEIHFKGNSTNKTFHEYIEEVTGQLNEAYQYHFKSNSDELLHNAQFDQKSEPEPELKITVLKRKLSF